jgi:hypothetical protein
MRRSGVLIVLGLALAMVPGCKKASESSAERAAERAIQQATGNKAEVNLSDAGVKISGKEGGKEFTFEGAAKGGIALPKSYPADVPSYPGASVLSSMSQGNEMTLVTLQTADAADKVYQFYSAKLKAGGWKIVNEVAAGQARLINGTKGARKADVTVIGGGAKCTVTVMYSDAKG